MNRGVTVYMYGSSKLILPEEFDEFVFVVKRSPDVQISHSASSLTTPQCHTNDGTRCDAPNSTNSNLNTISDSSNELSGNSEGDEAVSFADAININTCMWLKPYRRPHANYAWG